MMAVNLYWTVNSLSLSFQCLTRISRWTLVHLWDRVLVVIVDMEFFVRSKTPLTSEGMRWLLVKSWSNSNSEISLIIGSFEVRIEERNVNFAFVRYSASNSWNVDNIGMVYNSICNCLCEAKPALDLFGTLGLYFFDA